MTAPKDGLNWERSRRCDTNTCVEVSRAPSEEKVFLRDGKNPEGTIVTFPAGDWDGFLDEIKAGKHRIEAPEWSA